MFLSPSKFLFCSATRSFLRHLLSDFVSQFWAFTIQHQNKTSISICWFNSARRKKFAYGILRTGLITFWSVFVWEFELSNFWGSFFRMKNDAFSLLLVIQWFNSFSSVTSNLKCTVLSSCIQTQILIWLNILPSLDNCKKIENWHHPVLDQVGDSDEFFSDFFRFV